MMLLVAGGLGVVGWFVGAPEVLEIGVKNETDCMQKMVDPTNLDNTDPTKDGFFRLWAHGVCWKTTGRIDSKHNGFTVFPKIPVLMLSMWGGALLILIVILVMLINTLRGGGGGGGATFDPSQLYSQT
jgi:hypothetical protein